eukprot:scaffold145708_cov37-Prasinocladus_malaysianus.AAC.1
MAKSHSPSWVCYCCPVELSDKAIRVLPLRRRRFRSPSCIARGLYQEEHLPACPRTRRSAPGSHPEPGVEGAQLADACPSELRAFSQVEVGQAHKGAALADSLVRQTLVSLEIQLLQSCQPPKLWDGCIPTQARARFQDESSEVGESAEL